MLLVSSSPSNVQPSSTEETNPHEYSDNEVLIFAQENCKESILTYYSSYPRYNLTAYAIDYGFCSIDRKPSSKWYVTLRGSVFEPDIYATGTRETNTFSQTFTITESNGYLYTSGFEVGLARSLRSDKERFDSFRK